MLEKQKPVAWRWAVSKLRGCEWRYSLNQTKEDSQPLYSLDFINELKKSNEILRRDLQDRDARIADLKEQLRLLETRIAGGLRVFAYLDGGRYEAMDLVMERNLKHNATLLLDKDQDKQ